MAYGQSDVYYNPEDFGLELVGSIEWTGESYEFDMTGVWKETRGKYYIADDSGCSCPSPFESYTEKEHLDGPMRKEDLRKALEFRINERAGVDRRGYGRSRAELEKEVRDLLALLT